MIVGMGPGAGADAAAGRVTVVSAPPGSGKTVLLRSWIDEAGLSGRTAWVPVGRGKRDPQQFWLLVRPGTNGDEVNGVGRLLS